MKETLLSISRSPSHILKDMVRNESNYGVYNRVKHFEGLYEHSCYKYYEKKLNTLFIWNGIEKNCKKTSRNFGPSYHAHNMLESSFQNWH